MKTDIECLRFYCMLVILVLLVSCASVGKPPITVQSGRNIQQSPISKAPPLSNNMIQYHLDVMNTIKALWRMPKDSSKNDLLTVVVVKIRKDGTIVGITMEKASGNKAFDESIIRALRATDPLPPIPAALNTDSVELGFNFRPDAREEQSKN